MIIRLNKNLNGKKSFKILEFKKKNKKMSVIKSISLDCEKDTFKK